MKYRYRTTTVELKIDKNDTIYYHVVHTGNMGARVKNVTSNFRKLFEYGKDVEIIRKNETGSPDYLYEADFYLAT